MSSWLVPSDPQDAFDEIWKIHPELQNTNSSAWWFFMLLPKQEHGYGPRQMMFSYASRAGHLIAVRDKWQKGFNVETVDRGNGTAKFMTTVVGWIHDGEEVHEEIVHQGALAELSNDGYLRAFNQINGSNLGAEIRVANDKELGIDAEFVGKRGFAKFKVWSDPDEPEQHPQITSINPDIVGRFYNVNLVAWRKVHFAGTFKSPNGIEDLEGIAYFQRVLYNGPLGPWIWVWTVFEDQSVFSTFIPYLGLHNIRREDKLFSNWSENRLFKVSPSGYFIWESSPSDAAKETQFETIHMKIINEDQDLLKNLPIVKLKLSNDEGDWLDVVIRAHGHAQFHLERSVLKQFWKSRWNYNEYMVHIDYIQGEIDGKEIKTEMDGLGQGWGNMEYAFGMSL